jgi:cell division protein FtsB
LRHGKFIIRIALIAGVGAIFLYPGYRRLESFNHRLEQLNGDIRLLREKNKKLSEEIEALEHDPFRLEERARRMGLMKEGEVLYKVIEVEEEENDEGEPGEPEAAGH